MQVSIIISAGYWSLKFHQAIALGLDRMIIQAIITWRRIGVHNLLRAYEDINYWLCQFWAFIFKCSKIRGKELYNVILWHIQICSVLFFRVFFWLLCGPSKGTFSTSSNAYIFTILCVCVYLKDGYEKTGLLPSKWKACFNRIIV